MTIVRANYKLISQLSNFSMQEQPTVRQQQMRHRTKFNINHFEKWQDFKNLWKNVRFDDSLNDADEATIMRFWQKQLTNLTSQEKQICILVPVEVDKTMKEEQKVEVKSNDKETKKQQANKNVQIGVPKIEEGGHKSQQGKKEVENQKPNRQKNNKNAKGGKGNQRNNGRRQISRVKLNKNILQIAMKLVDQKFPTLSFAYESIFYGNEKQLLIYRACSSLEQYLMKYRLPKDFKDKYDKLIQFSDQLYQLKLKRNLAISTFDRAAIDQVQKIIQSLNNQFNQHFQAFKAYLHPILEDFKTNKIVQSIYLKGMRGHLISPLEEYVKSHELFLLNKYYQCDYDEVRDMLINKIYFESLQKEVVKQKYVYVDPPKLPQLPKDIIEVKLVGSNIVKKCWVWRIQMPNCSKYNKFKGLFFRAPEGLGTAQYSIQLAQNTEIIDVQLLPYRVGKVVWEIYVWNDVGFTKSSQKIVHYSDFGGPDITLPMNDLKITLVGKSECGIILEEAQSLVTKVKYKCKDMSLYNASIICDSVGNCASWGEMFYTESHQDEKFLSLEQILFNLNKNLRIECPFLLLTNKFIRKVSCGLGYSLMLNSLGVIWSIGYNKLGQLGLGHFQSTAQHTEPQQIPNFVIQSNSIIVDICATSKGACFAIDDRGVLYRWGYNQIQETQYPIYDRFNTVINYQTGDILYKSATPSPIRKNLLNGQVGVVEAGDEQFFALTRKGELYGWGVVDLLGVGVLKDPSEIVIKDIVNPIQILSQVEQVSTNMFHTVVLTKSKRILAWGRACNFSNKLQGNYTLPVDITDQFGNGVLLRIIKAGVNYTVGVRQDNTITILGSQTILKVKEDTFKTKIENIVCSKCEELFAVLIDQE